MRASVPELTNQTILMLGTAEITISGRTFSERQGVPEQVPFFIVSARAARTYRYLQSQWRNPSISGSKFVNVSLLLTYKPLQQK